MPFRGRAGLLGVTFGSGGWVGILLQGVKRTENGLCGARGYVWLLIILYYKAEVVCMHYSMAFGGPAGAFKIQSSYGFHSKEDGRILRKFHQESKQISFD